MRRRNQNGVALVFAIIAILILAIVGGTFLKRSQQSRELSRMSSQKTLHGKEVLGVAELIRTKLISDFNLLPSPLKTPSEISALAEADKPLSTWLSNWVTAYNSAGINQENGQKIVELICVNQDARDLQTGLPRPEDCTRHRDRMPKYFRLKVVKTDPEGGAFTTTQEFKISKVDMNQFVYVVSHAPSDLLLGNVTFDGPVGLFFDRPSSSSLNFVGVQSGSIFRGPIYTNLPTYQGKFNGSGKFETSDLNLGQSNFFESEVQSNFYALKNDASTIKTNFESDLRAACMNNPSVQALHGGGPPPAAMCSVRILSSIYLLPSASSNCQLRIRQTGEWHYYESPAQDFRGIIENAAPSMVNAGLTANLTQSQTAGAVYYLKGLAYIGSDVLDAEYHSSKICERQTFMADSISIMNSIEKDPDASYRANNSALIAEGSISIHPKVRLFSSGALTSISAVQRLGTPCCGISSSAVSLVIQASLITGPTGSVTVTPFAYDYNYGSSTSDNPRTLGTFEIEGMVVTSQPLVTSQKWTSNNLGGSPGVAGFNQVNFKRPFRFTENPPPGLSFKRNSISQTLLSVSTSKVDFVAGAEELRRQ